MLLLARFLAYKNIPGFCIREVLTYLEKLFLQKVKPGRIKILDFGLRRDDGFFSVFLSQKSIIHKLGMTTGHKALICCVLATLGVGAW